MTVRRRKRAQPRFGPAQGPIVVGGVGGSGTRLVAEVMRRLGIYTGSDLNDFGDNLWFTLLCKLPGWDISEDSTDTGPILESLTVLERAMTGTLVPDGIDKRTIALAIARADERARGSRLADDNQLPWLERRGATLRRSRRHVPDGAPLWGWKEPNSHLFLPQLQAHFGDRLRYVHVIRNGLYMAHSQNQHQVRRWGPTFGLADTDSPAASLDYWILANELALARGRAMPEGSFLLLNHDEFCSSPRQGVARLVDFIGLEPSGPLLAELASLPRPPSDSTVSMTQLLDDFGPERLARVRALGF